MLDWQQRQVSDDQGRPGAPALVETVYYATGPDGSEWVVAPHDNTNTWNWIRSDPTGDPWQYGTDFATAAAALEAANKHARSEYRGSNDG